MRGRFAGSRGYTSLRGKTTIFISAIMETLHDLALRRAMKLKEAHVRDDIIETLVHEDLHRAMLKETTAYRYEMEDRYDVETWQNEEELVVDTITQDVMEDIRELPRLGRRPDIHGAIVRRPVPVRHYRRRRTFKYS